MNIVPFNRLPCATIPPEASSAVPDPFESLRLDPNIELQYLIEIYPYDKQYEYEILRYPNPIGGAAFNQIRVKGYGGVHLITLADQHFITEPDDEVPNKYYMPVVNNPLQFDISILRGNELGIGAVSFGAIEINNAEDDLDHLARMNWRGRRIVIKTGRKGWRYSAFIPVFDGLCNGVELTDTVITLTFQDIGMRLENDIVSPSFAGTGGLEGGAELSGKMKPLLYGHALNIEPVLVDPVNLIYQIHSGGMQSVDGVYDSAIALSFHQDVADITTANPGNGEYATSLTTGYIKLGSTPVGRITADAKGDNTGGYVSTAGDITRRIVTSLIGNISLQPSEIDDNAFDALNTVISGACGLYILERRTVRQFIDELIPACGGYWYFNRIGLLTCDHIDTVGLPQATIDPSNIDTAGIEAELPIPASWRISVAYGRAWTVQKENEIAGGATPERRGFVGQEYRLTVSQQPTVLETDPQAIERTFYSPFTNKSDADELLARLVRVYGQERHVYRVPVYGALYRNYLGDTVRFSYPRYGIDKAVSVVGISEDAQTGQTVMELWG